MRDVRAKTIVSVDTISKGNIKPWIKLIDFMKEVPADEEINFTFEDIQVYQPWNAYTFINLLSDSRVHMTFINDEESVKTIELMLHLNGFKTGRIVNRDTRTNNKEDKHLAVIQEKAKGLQPYFHANPDGSVTFKVTERYDQIGVIDTVKYIEAALVMRHEMTGETEMILDTGKITLYANILEAVSKIFDTMHDIGVKLYINSGVAEINDKINLYRGLSGSQAGTREHFEICQARLKDNCVGMLAKYRDSKGKDEFGRHGRGEIVTNRIAIFRGFKFKEGRPCLEFQVFNGKTFFPREHWYLENDSQILVFRTGRDMTEVERNGYNHFTDDGEAHTIKKMDVQDMVIPLEEVGIYNDFLGSKYHFMAPIQKHKRDSKNVFTINDDGFAKCVKMTIPELAKAVLDDYAIEYNKPELESCIARTKDILSTSGEPDEPNVGSSDPTDAYSDYNR